MAAGRALWKDDRIDIIDIHRINMLAEEFGVSRDAAFGRAKGLGLLSYQQDPAP